MENQFIDVPIERLSQDLLQKLVEDFVLREGTDYGQHEYNLEQKVDQVLKSLKKGRAKVVFDPVLETHTILTSEQFRRLSEAGNEKE